MRLDHATIGQRLQAARRALGLTQTDVAQQMDMVTSTISAVEAGKRAVTGVELYRFAQVLQRPLAYFLEPEQPPVSPGFQYLFRQADEEILDRPSLVKLEQLASDYELLEELVGTPPLPLPPDYSSFDFRTEQDAEMLAEMERSRVGLGDAPLTNLAELLDTTIGVRVFMLPVAHQSWSGAVARDRSGRPLIGVNSKEEFYRRNFDLAHDYGHILVHLAGGHAPPARIEIGRAGARRSADERFADAFAAAFLMPRRAVLAQVERALRTNDGRFTDFDLVHLAMHFGVSGQALSLRLVTLRKLPRSTHDEYWNQTTFKAIAHMLGYQVEDPEGFWKAPVILPARFRALAMDAYQAELISLAKLAELLRENPYELRSKLREAKVAVKSAGAGA